MCDLSNDQVMLVARPRVRAGRPRSSWPSGGPALSNETKIMQETKSCAVFRTQMHACMYALADWPATVPATHT